MKLVLFRRASEARLGFLSGEIVIDPLLADGDRAVFAERARVHQGRRSAMRRREGDAGQSAESGDDRAEGRDARRADPARHHPMQRQQLPDHNAEKANTPISGKEPEFFVKTADCVVGPDEPIAFDERFSKKIDCETELAVVIGKPGRFIGRARTRSCVRLHDRQRRHRA